MTSSGDSMKVDYGHLDDLHKQLSSALKVIGLELESSVGLAANCGDAGLGGKIIDFGQSWNKHRFDIRDELTWLRDSVKNIHDKLEESDKTLADGVTMKPAPVSPTAVK